MVFHYDPVHFQLTAMVLRLPMLSFTIDTRTERASAQGSEGGADGGATLLSEVSSSTTRVMACLAPGDSIEFVDPKVPTAARLCVASGPGLESAEQRVPSGFQLRAYNEDAFAQSIGQDAVTFLSLIHI